MKLKIPYEKFSNKQPIRIEMDFKKMFKIIQPFQISFFYV